jgi:hypothetical protein
MSSLNIATAAVATGLSACINAGLYYANSKIFDLAPPKAAAIYSAANTVTTAVVTGALALGAIHLGLEGGGKIASNPTRIIGSTQGDAGDAIIKSLAGGLYFLAVAGSGVIASAIAGTAAGIFTGKKVAAKSGNPLTYKQIFLLAAVYKVESTLLNGL